MGHYSEADVFVAGKGSFNVAFGLISFEPGDTSVDNDYSDYGQMRARLKKWGGGLAGTQFFDVETRPCTPEDFSDDDESLFYPVYENHRSTFEYYFDKM